MEYRDNPLTNRTYIKTLSNKELAIYVQGYIMACTHMRESFTESRTEFLKVRLNCPAGSYKARLLESHIALLDAIETIVVQKEGNLRAIFPDKLPASS